MVLINKRASGVIQGAAAGWWDTMVDFLGQGEGGTGITYQNEGATATPFMRTTTGNMRYWMSDVQREMSIVGFNSGVAGVLGPNLRLIGDTLTSVPAVAFYQTNAVLGDTHLGSMLGDDQNVNIYAFPATYSLAFLTYDTSPDAVGAKLWIGPGDTATIQWWSNAWFRIYSDEGVTETLAINGQTGQAYFHGDILDADTNINDVGGPANEFLNYYMGTGRFYMYTDQQEWMYSTGGDIRWGVGGVDELFLSTTALGPVTAEGLSLGGTANEFLSGYFGDAGFLYFGLGQDARLRWDNASAWFAIQTEDGIGGFANRMYFTAGALEGLAAITVLEPTTFSGADVIMTNNRIGRTYATVTMGAGGTTFAAATELIELTGDVGANTIATITGGLTGQYMLLLFVDGLITITNDDTHAANTIDLVGGANLTSADDTTLLLFFNGTSWYEVSRSVN